MDTSNGQPLPTSSKATRGAMLTVFLVVFIDLLGFGIVLPLLPRYADELLKPLGMKEWQSGVVLGILYSSFSFMQFIVAPLWGRFSDRVGRKPVLLIGLGGSVVFYALFGFASQLDPINYATLAIVLILISRIGAGISGATIATAAAVIADCTTREKRASGMALIGAAFGIGFTFGPLIAFFGMTLFKNEKIVPGLIAASLSLIALIIAFKKMPETHQPREDAHRSWLNVHGLYSTLQIPTVGILVLTFFLATFGFANFEGTLSLFGKETFGYGDKDNCLIFAYVGFTLMVAQGFAYRKLVKKLDEVALMRIGIAFMLIGLFGLAMTAVIADGSRTSGQVGGEKVLFYVTIAIAVFGFAFLNPSVNGLISRRSDPERQGEVLGVNQSFSALAQDSRTFPGSDALRGGIASHTAVLSRCWFAASGNFTVTSYQTRPSYLNRDAIST